MCTWGLWSPSVLALTAGSGCQVEYLYSLVYQALDFISGKSEYAGVPVCPLRSLGPRGGPHQRCPSRFLSRQAKQLSSTPEGGTRWGCQLEGPQEAGQKVRLPGCLAVPTVPAPGPLSPLSSHSSGTLDDLSDSCA